MSFSAADLDFDTRDGFPWVYMGSQKLASGVLENGDYVCLQYDGIDIYVEDIEYEDNDTYSGEIVRIHFGTDVISIGDVISFNKAHVFSVKRTD